jgi:hypothetical protein
MFNLSKPNWNELRSRVLEWVYQNGTYNVQWTAPTTNPTIGDGSLIGRYVRRGNLCRFQIILIFGTTTTAGSGNWSFSLPFASSTGVVSSTGVAPCHVRDAGLNNYERFGLIPPNTSVMTTFVQLDNATNVNFLNATTPFTWGNGDSLNIDGEYWIK